MTSTSKDFDISLEEAPKYLEKEYNTIFTAGCKRFLCELLTKFEEKVEKILLQREIRRLKIVEGEWQPILNTNKHGNWQIDDIPERIKNRKLDLGDISPARTINFTDALYMNVQGIQVSSFFFFRLDLLIFAQM